ncbi:E3 SUMO-protein ligase pli1 [Cryomyces antarcticus]|nr:E3 SUMO-protein ligase pli1 [Cryomyces antarcticus]
MSYNLAVLKHYSSTGDVRGLNRLRFRASNHGNSPPPEGGPEAMSSASPPSLRGPNYMAGGSYRPLYPPAPPRSQPAYANRITFKPSPFYEIAGTIGRAMDLPILPGNRQTLNLPITLATTDLERLKTRSWRVMLYCAMDANGMQFALHDIAFPHQLEIKVNQEDVKANYKGLKNKPGSTKPVDITDLLRKTPDGGNAIQVTYALTQKAGPFSKFTLVANLVKKRSAQELTEKIKRGHVISKQKVIQEMVSKANDPDIVATSTVMSLKDPLSMLRLDLPCRSTEQAPTWTCPICNKIVSFDALCIDEYVQEILNSTSADIDQVTIEPDGRWSKNVATDGSANQNGAAHDDDGDEDDLVEIVDAVKTFKKENSTALPSYITQTPPLSSREASAATSSARTGNKRSSAAVIVISDDDDDEEPVRPMKRQVPNYNTSYNTPNSMAGYPNGHNNEMPYVPGANMPRYGLAQARTNNGVTPFRIDQPGGGPLALPPNPPPTHTPNEYYQSSYTHPHLPYGGSPG